jgi:hypothetical protein
MVSQIIRLDRLYNRRGRDGLLGVGRTKLFSDLIFRDADRFATRGLRPLSRKSQRVGQPYDPVSGEGSHAPRRPLVGMWGAEGAALDRAHRRELAATSR